MKCMFPVDVNNFAFFCRYGGDVTEKGSFITKVSVLVTQKGC